MGIVKESPHGTHDIRGLGNSAVQELNVVSNAQRALKNSTRLPNLTHKAAGEGPACTPLRLWACVMTDVIVAVKLA